MYVPFGFFQINVVFLFFWGWWCCNSTVGTHSHRFLHFMSPLCFNYYAHRLCKNERMNIEVYHAHIKLGFQMFLKDCCKTMNMHINLIDLYLLSSGIYKCIYAKKEKSYDGIKNYQSTFFLFCARLVNRWRRSYRSLSTCCCC
jgi:hypothetical protein